MQRVKKKTVEATLVFFVKDNKVLLSEKQRKVGAGYLNGFGGKVRTGETLLQAATRETEEEVGLIPTRLYKCAEVTINREEIMHVHIFIATDWSGDVRESEEMKNPDWYPVNDLPYERMLPSDRLWIDWVFSKRFKGAVSFHNNGEPDDRQSWVATVKDFN